MVTDEAPGWPELLHQDEIWINAGRQTLRLDDMDAPYCANVHSFLLRQARPHLTQCLWDMTLGPSPSGDVACDAFEAEYAELERANEDPIGWMTGQPLLIALARRMEGKPARPEEAETDMVTPVDWDDMETDAGPDWRAAPHEGPRQYGALLDFARWVISLDDVEGPGAEERRTVTLTKIIQRAREALGEAT
ncbi:hypothetical protein [Streptomyces sp. 5-10]|uniref:hypothetical protein n=1 Tax=Streptomyces sp. 5-10 TaxID=878925 RepID=UPI00168BA0EF|nr:hypothetical protein [Streptomyces sp. 5-10]MBD3004804.1 hypothetical protein [Streptomyces sp. 5-10]